MAAEAHRLPKLAAVDLGPDNWRLLRTVVDAVPYCIKVVAQDGRLLQMNAAGLRMIEATAWEAVDGACIFDLIAAEHRPLWREQHNRVCQGETLTWQFDIIGLTGARRHMETSAIPIMLSDGSIGQLAFTHDVTERREAECRLEKAKRALEVAVSDQTKELKSARQQLYETERSFALLLERVTDCAIYLLDREGRVASWNAGARRITGYEAEETIGRHFSCFFTAEDQAAGLPERNLAAAARDGKFEQEGWRIRKDGSRFLASVTIEAIRDGGRLAGFAKITRDITEKRAADERLRQAEKMEAIGQFTGGAAHDFSNLLMAISGSLELLRKRLPEDARSRDLLDNAVQASKRGVSLTQRMLAFARRQELKFEPVDVIALVEGMRDLLEHSVGPSIQIQIQRAGELAPVITDSNQLETALLNLAINARDAMPSGGTITITAAETYVARGDPSNLSPGRYTRLSFADTGHGMDEATLARVTEPFFTTKGVGKGTGLGLAMVDRLCAQSGGRLSLRSQLGVGTTIELWLPVATAEGHVITLNAGPEPETPLLPRAPRLRILVIDDDSLVLKSSAAMLEDLGHLVEVAPSGERALELIMHSDAAIDIVIADHLMSGMTGREFAQALKTVRPGVPVILATGKTDLPADTGEAVLQLTKPFDQRQLAEALARCVRRSEIA